MKKTTSKLLSLLLAVVMVIGIFPVTAFATKTDGKPDIAISGVQIPTVGEEMDCRFTSLESNNYEHYLGRGEDYDDGRWWIETDKELSHHDSLMRAATGGSYFDPPNNVFKDGQYYTYAAVFGPKYGFSFDKPNEVTASINGETEGVHVDFIELADPVTGHLIHPFVVWKTFGPVKAIDTASVSVTPPKAGAAASSAAATVPDGVDYEVAKIEWLETASLPASPMDAFNDYSEGKEGVKLLNGTFQKDKYYTAVCYLKPKDTTDVYAVFSDNATVYINGYLSDAEAYSPENGKRQLITAYSYGPLSDMDVQWSGEFSGKWTSVADAERYYVRLYENGKLLFVAAWADTKFDFYTPIELGAEYFFEVFAIDDDGKTIAQDFSPMRTFKEYHDITVGNGIAKVKGEIVTSAAVGDEVTLEAHNAPSGRIFDQWVTSYAELVDPTARTTTFVMPDHKVIVSATYMDAVIPLLGITPPLSGGTPTAIDNVKPGFSGYTLSDLKWYDVTNNRYLADGEKFGEKTEYRLELSISATGSKRFREEKDLSVVWSEDKKFSVEEYAADRKGPIKLSYTFPETKVKPVYSWTITPDPEINQFQSVAVGYETAPSVTYTFKNTGNVDIPLNITPVDSGAQSSSTNFDLDLKEFEQGYAVQPGNSVSFTIKLKADRSAGMYYSCYMVNGDPVYFPVQVNEKYDLTLESTGTDSSGDGTYQANTWINIDAGVQDGSVFGYWTASDSHCLIEDRYSAETRVQLLDRNLTLTANWYPDSANQTLTVTQRFYESCDLSNSQYKSTLNSTVTGAKDDTYFAPDLSGSGYEIAEILVDGEDVNSTDITNAKGKFGTNSSIEVRYRPKQFNLTWDFGGVSLPGYELYTAPGNVDYNSTILYPSDISMTKTGYTFIGWDQTITTMPDKAVTITALWKENPKYAVTVTNGSATDYEDNPVTEVYDGEEFDITANEPADNKIFSHWEVTSGGASIYDPMAEKSHVKAYTTEPIVIAAVYRDIVLYDITVNGGTAYDEMGSSTITKAEPGNDVLISLNSTDIPEGYEFDKWVVSTDEITLKDASIQPIGFTGWGFTMPDTPVTITAAYKKTAVPQTPVSITTASISSATAGTPYSQTLESNPSTDVTWMQSAGKLPNGMSLGLDGMLTGTPAKGGSYTFTAKVMHTSGSSAERQFTFTVNEKPTVTTTSLPGAVVGDDYSQTLYADGYPTDMTWASPDLPAWLNLSTDGKLTGTPALAHKGTHTFKVKATNSVGVSEDKELSIVVSEKVYDVYLTPGTGYAIAPVAGFGNTAVEGSDYKFTVTIAAGYKKDGAYFKVKANDAVLTGNGDEYIISNVVEDQIVTVEGVVVDPDYKAATPIINPNGGSFTDSQIVTITCSTAGAKIYYTTDGSDPLTSATAKLYSTPITLTDTITIKAFAWTWEIPESDVASAKFTKKSDGGTIPTYDYYTLTFDTNGGSYIAPITRIEGTNVNLASYTPTREGYDFTGWYSSAALTGKITSITLNSDKTVYAGWEKENPQTGGWENPFIDVFEKDWFYDDVRFINENNLMVGTSSNTFSPNVTTTRGMIVTILYRLEGEPTVSGACPFDDVKSGMYYEDAIIWAAANGIVMGYGNNKFGSEDEITREQMAAILFRYADYKGYNISGRNNLAAFTDAGKVSSYALDNVKWAVDAGLINGMGDGTLAPQGSATRAQIAAILHRFIDKFVK